MQVREKPPWATGEEKAVCTFSRAVMRKDPLAPTAATRTHPGWISQEWFRRTRAGGPICCSRTEHEAGNVLRRHGECPADSVPRCVIGDLPYRIVNGICGPYMNRSTQFRMEVSDGVLDGAPLQSADGSPSNPAALASSPGLSSATR